MNVAFLDTETTGLDPRRHEVGILCDHPRPRTRPGRGHTHLFQIAVDLDTADDDGTHHWQIPGTRRAVPDRSDGSGVEYSHDPERLRHRQANPTFDVGFTALLQRHGLDLPWHYRPICVEAVAYGFMQGFAQAQFGAVITDFCAAVVGDGSHWPVCGSGEHPEAHGIG